MHARSTTMKPTSCATVVSHSPKKGAKHGQFTLLDNEYILHSVRRYLAAQNLGTITPQELCCHINQVIIPPLDLLEKKSSICKCTAINWSNKLGYKCTDVKKGVYHDGQKCPNVIEACKKFLDQIQQYEWWVSAVHKKLLSIDLVVKLHVQVWWWNSGANSANPCTRREGTCPYPTRWMHH